jgi:hypothetical protein
MNPRTNRIRESLPCALNIVFRSSCQGRYHWALDRRRDCLNGREITIRSYGKSGLNDIYAQVVELLG